MKRFGDPGAPYGEVTSAVFTAADQKARAERKWAVFTGVLKGSPLDLLNRKGGTSQHQP